MPINSIRSQMCVNCSVRSTPKDKYMRLIQMSLLLMYIIGFAPAQVVEFSYQKFPAKNLGPQKCVMRRDPSDIIRVNELYYVWYTKGQQQG